MTTTARIAATKALATYDATITATTHFAAIGLKGDERIIVKISDSSTNYVPLMYEDNGGHAQTAELTARKNTITLNGGDVRFEKDPTANTVELVEYS